MATDNQKLIDLLEKQLIKLNELEKPLREDEIDDDLQNDKIAPILKQIAIVRAEINELKKDNAGIITEIKLPEGFIKEFKKNNDSINAIEKEINEIINKGAEFNPKTYSDKLDAIGDSIYNNLNPMLNGLEKVIEDECQVQIRTLNKRIEALHSLIKEGTQSLKNAVELNAKMQKILAKHGGGRKLHLWIEKKMAELVTQTADLTKKVNSSFN